MVTSICHRMGSFLKNHPVAVERAIKVGAAGVAYYFAGIPAMIVGFGGLHALLKWDKSSNAKQPEPAKKASEPTTPKTSSFEREEKEGIQGFLIPKDFYVVDRARIDRVSHSVVFAPSAALRPPVGDPCRIIWRSNSCFLSSTMWPLILNEPTLLQEIPAAIHRRLGAMNDSMNAILQDPNISEKSRAAFIDLGVLLGTKKRLEKGDLRQCCETLQKLNDGTFPYRLKELQSLLELYLLVDHCQNNDIVDGNEINKLRQIVRRVNANFRDHGFGPGDADEVFKTLTDLIFNGSRFNQNLVTTHFVRSDVPDIQLDPVKGGNPASGELNSHPTQPNWGRFELPLVPKASVKKLLEKELDEADHDAKLNCWAQGFKDPMPFTVTRKQNQFDFAPPFLVLNVKRLPNTKNTTEPMNAEEFFELNGRHFRDGRGGVYELYGVSRHLGDFAHYVADFKRDRGTIYHCDDLRGKAERSKHSTLIDSANAGYILLYRKIDKMPEKAVCIVM